MKKRGVIGIRSKRSTRALNQLSDIKCLPDSKRSQSGIIVTVLMIMMILVAIVVVWNVVHFTVSKSASQVSPDTFTTKITVPSTKLYLTGGAQVQVHRGTGKETLTALKFIFQKKSGETNTLIINTNLPNELDTKIYNLNSSQISFNNSDITKISVVPVFGTNMGIQEEETKTYQTDSSGNRVLDIPGNSGLISWWKFDGNLQDSVGNSPGTCTTCPTLTTDNHGNANSAYSFNGVNNYINTSSNAFFYPNKNFTISAWFKTSIGSQGTIAAQDGMLGGWYLSTSPAPRVIMKDGTTAVAFDSSATGSYNDNNWHSVFVIINTSTTNLNFNNAVFYVDGVIVQSPSPSKIKVYGTSSTPFTIGARDNGNSIFFNGVIDNVMIFNRSLSADEINALYNNQK